MTAPTISEYLKYAHLQIAAEAFIRDEVSEQLADGQDRYIAALVRGNDHSSRFVESQAKTFAGEWEVLDQRANTKTGFREGLQNPIRQTSAVRQRARARLMPAQSADSGQFAPVWRLVSALAAPPWRPADAPIPAVP